VKVSALRETTSGGPNPAWPNGTLLGGLSPADVGALTTLGSPRTYQPGEILVREGDRDTHAVLLLCGYVKILGNTVDGTVVLLNVRAGGEIVGELAAFDNKPRSATAVAATRTEARLMAQRVFLAVLSERPAIATMMHSTIATKLRMATRHRINVGGAPLQTRLARVIDHLVEAYGVDCRTGVQIGVPLSQTDLAALVGAAEPSVHRALTELRRRRVLTTGYRRLIVCDRPLLQSLAAGAS
jgi:CRP-like cAMP-binding protein